MKRLASIYSLILLVILIIGCGATPKQPEETSLTKTQDKEGPSLSFDPLDLKIDQTVVPATYPRTGVVTGAVIAQDETDVTGDSVAIAVTTIPDQIDSLNNQAYRVQIFTSKVYGEARHALKVAEEIFDRPVSVDYEVPYFKVRVGQFSNRDDAERYARRAEEAGYNNAWVVMVNVNIREAAPLYDEDFPPFIFEDSTALLDTVPPDNDEEDDQN